MTSTTQEILLQNKVHVVLFLGLFKNEKHASVRLCREVTDIVFTSLNYFRVEANYNPQVNSVAQNECNSNAGNDILYATSCV
jgi:hypothetical protein